MARFVNLPAEFTLWLGPLPSAYEDQVVAPQRFETHVDAAARARMVVGLDAQGQRCFVHHEHTVTEDRFDIDEQPLEVPVLRERRCAWRLSTGFWLRLGERQERLDSCRPRCLRDGPELLSGGPGI